MIINKAKDNKEDIKAIREFWKLYKKDNNLQEIRCRCCKRDVDLWRKFIYIIINKGYMLEVVSNALGRDHSTIIYNYRKWEQHEIDNGNITEKKKYFRLKE